MRKSTVNVIKMPTIEVDAEITHRFTKEETSPAATAIAAGVIAGSIFVAGVAWHGAKRLVNSIRCHRADTKISASSVSEIAEVLEDNDKD